MGSLTPRKNRLLDRSSDWPEIRYLGVIWVADHESRVRFVLKPILGTQGPQKGVPRKNRLFDRSSDWPEIRYLGVILVADHESGVRFALKPILGHPGPLKRGYLPEEIDFLKGRPIGLKFGS
jgi:hypothetical protein